MSGFYFTTCASYLFLVFLSLFYLYLALLHLLVLKFKHSFCITSKCCYIFITDLMWLQIVLRLQWQLRVEFPLLSNVVGKCDAMCPCHLVMQVTMAVLVPIVTCMGHYEDIYLWLLIFFLASHWLHLREAGREYWKSYSWDHSNAIVSQVLIARIIITWSQGCF